jgi:hypothetical protein
VAGPIRFRRSTEGWSRDRVRGSLHQPLDQQFGATISDPLVAPPGEYEAVRLEMDNGDLALFAWNDDGFWLGNTETPSTLWKTDKETFDEAPYALSRWAQRELMATLEREEPWLTEYRYLAWFFLPVLFSKDGRETTRRFFREHAAGFPDADRETALAFYDDFLRTGVLEDYRYVMASKLGTSPAVDLSRMQATMGEFNAAWLLDRAGHRFEPEVELDSGHSLDFRVGDTLVEVTRPQPPSQRRAGTPASALRETVDGKTEDQLRAHEGAVLMVDCTSFHDDEWASVLAEQPAPGYRPAIVFRVRPDGTVEGYTAGSVPLDVGDLL